MTHDTLTLKSKKSSDAREDTPTRKPVRTTTTARAPKSNTQSHPNTAKKSNIASQQYARYTQDPRPKPTRTQTNSTQKFERPKSEERIDLQKIFVYRLAPTGLAYQISMAAHLMVAIGEGYSLQQLLSQVNIEEAARPNVQRLTFDTLRHWGTTQYWINQHISQPPAEWIQAVLCVALTQLLLNAENEFTLVNEAVLAVDNNKPHAKGMTNAILRKFLRERDTWIIQAQSNEVAQYNHPQWWINTIKAQYPEDWQTILKINNSHPPMSLRVNAQKYTTTDYQKLLQKNNKLSQGNHLSEQALILETPCSVTELPEFEQGAVSIQDIGAQLSAQLLAPESGQRVLDACAAPGGKTAHLLELHPDLQLTAIEKDPIRADRIHANLERLQLNAHVIVTDANNVHQWWDGTPFDRILLDAPCSASGIVRRQPDIRWLRQEEDLVGLAQQQAALLRTMWKVLAPEGRLVYCTCSIFDSECEQVIHAFLAHTPNARRIYPDQLKAAHGPQNKTHHNAPIGQLLPNADTLNNHDGFFYAVLEKTTTNPNP